MKVYFYDDSFAVFWILYDFIPDPTFYTFWIKTTGYKKRYKNEELFFK